MNTNTVLGFLGWAALIYTWLKTNFLFFNAIADAINSRDKQIRQKAMTDSYKFLKQNDRFKSEEESEEESEVEREVVVETTVTKTISKS